MVNQTERHDMNAADILKLKLRIEALWENEHDWWRIPATTRDILLRGHAWCVLHEIEDDFQIAMHIVVMVEAADECGYRYAPEVHAAARVWETMERADIGGTA